MPDTVGLLYLHALTSVHPGTGSAIGAVDLPIQRERHTEWPTISGSALKGVLRDVVRQTLMRKKNANTLADADKSEEVQIIFGPSTSESSNNKDTFAGALSVTDARILAFPVRSLSGVFAWVTSPAVLARFSRDLELGNNKPEWKIPNVKEGNALVAADSELVVPGNKLVLEEYELTVNGDASAIANYLAEVAISNSATKELMKKNLVIIHDNQFNHYVKYATEIQARIALDYDTKSVKEGALFYEEFLPSETVFYSVVIFSDSRKKDNSKQGKELFAQLKDSVTSVIQIGGDETIGKGYCALNWQTGA